MSAYEREGRRVVEWSCGFPSIREACLVEDVVWKIDFRRRRKGLSMISEANCDTLLCGCCCMVFYQRGGRAGWRLLCSISIGAPLSTGLPGQKENLREEQAVDISGGHDE